MPLHPNSQRLVDTLEALPLLDGRYQNIKHVNFDALNDKKRGCFSLVFRADDTISGKTVALKFYDLDPRWTNDPYRVAAFQREHTILSGLLTVKRCLQLVSGMSAFQMDIHIPGSAYPVSIACQYFAIEWLDDDIDAYFFEQETFDAVVKLLLFNEVLLAVEALHAKDVFHRDLKVDNLRAKREAGRREVVAIDLGTAARLDSGNIQEGYGGSVGAPAYASPEAICGLAGNRLLGKYNDLYAVGCLLYELFNKDLFYVAVRARTNAYDILLAAMADGIRGAIDDAEQAGRWRSALTVFEKAFAHVPIDGPGSNAPAGVAMILNEVLSTLTNINFSKRMSLSEARRKTWNAIRILRNQKAYDIRVEQNRERKRIREEKLKLKEARLQNALAKRKLSC